MIATLAPLPTARPSSWHVLPAPARDRDALDSLRPLGIAVRLGRNQGVYVDGDPADYCYRVVSGAVRTCKLMADGRRQIADFMLPGDVFGLEAVKTRPLSAEAVVDSVLVRYPRRGIENLAEHDAALARRLRELLYESLATTQQRMVLLGRKTAEERLASFLLEMTQRAASDGKRYELPMTRQDIADHLGLTMETVSRTFSKFRRKGAIALPSTHSIEILDRKVLAGFDAC